MGSVIKTFQKNKKICQDTVKIQDLSLYLQDSASVEPAWWQIFIL